MYVWGDFLGSQVDILFLFQFDLVRPQFSSSIAGNINSYCSLNEERARECCYNNLNYR